jgi:hypothetical protein
MTDPYQQPWDLPLQTRIVSAQSPWRKAAALVRERGLGEALAHAHTVGLHKAHAAVDRRLRPGGVADATDAKVELEALTIGSANRGAGVHYLPTPWRVLDWLHRALPEPDAGWSFVDLGCGKGRVLVSASRRPYGRVIGVEFARELAQTARVNVASVASAAGLAAGTVQVVDGDAATFALPETPLVVFLFNPFGPPVIERVAERIERSYRDKRRPMLVAYLNPVHAEAFRSLAGFRRVILPVGLALRFALASPYRLELLATAEVPEVVRARHA